MLLALTSVARLPPAKLSRLFGGPAPVGGPATRRKPSPVGFPGYRGDHSATPPQRDIASLVAIVTPATSISFFRPELDAFLHAPIGQERNEMPLSVLSALARLGLDPWKEATELSELPGDSATQRLATLIMRLPGGRLTQADLRGIAHRLIELLPRRSNPTVPLMEKVPSIPRMLGSPTAKMLICAALAGIALFSAASCEPSSGAEPGAFRTTEAAHRYLP